MIGSSLGRYRILSELGRGGMGIVYGAHDSTLERTVAIKILKPDLPQEAMLEMKARFLREAKSAGRLNHPNIVTVYDVGVAGDTAYIAMEHLEGRSLRQLLDSGAALSFQSIADIVAQIAEALDYAGRFGIVHRDIKPANIMIAPTGLVTLTDFGVAYVPSSSMTQTGSMLGSPKYMSPEQVQEKPVDRRADLFSLGIVLYEMLMRKTPFERPDMTLFSLMDLIVKQPVAPVSEQDPGIPAVFDAILARALAKRPEDRYQRGREFADELRSVKALAASARFPAEPEPSVGDPETQAKLAALLADLETTSRLQAPAQALSAKLRQGLLYLQELVHHIIRANPAFTVELDLLYLGSLPAMTLGEGVVDCLTKKLGDEESVDCVTLTYRMSSQKKARIALDAQEAQVFRAHLDRAKLKYDHREIRNESGALQCEAFVIDVDISASVTLRGDYEAQSVEIACQNVGLIGPAKYRLESAEFDEAIWEFGKLLLGFPSRFAGLRLPA